ncbi:beta-ketoacyl synthase N-terminal-like domain-containing protein [Paenibacillus roseipurpureus]|uniref:Beta-ketoacyl synthase N-terminal-like domain-containing protein n=1 Tax=Paenibacillus roseopurpureus TaxID=2918901 RepID=A0AA96LM59_9BACL|nr:beta-ketoacyl synthase N-terminal-like domain-containing protein [Paenibacillus sp. MBLB1832]WNR44537.1 beta-ketoacyl synthase N-terminal-like domain-containing protein [Paenibacillus sp. MBLB1832]
MDNVVITGYGIKAPHIDNKMQFKTVLEHGICTHRVVKDRLKGRDVVCGVIDHEFKMLRGKNLKRYPRVSRLAMAAADEAMEMAAFEDRGSLRIAVILGTSAGGISDIAVHKNTVYEKFPIHSIALANAHSLSSAVAHHLEIVGQVYTLTTGCTSSSDAIMMGKMLLDSGTADVCVVGGSDAAVTEWSLMGFLKMQGITTDVDIHQTGVPFSKGHQGFVMAEGAGVLILEREKSARQRGAKLFGVIKGVASANDGTSILASDETGQNMLQALSTAVGDHTPTYVNSQALGLKVNDEVDSIVHKTLFGSSVPITSIKGMTGHTLGSMGVIQVISSLLSIEYGFIPPTIKTNGDGFEDLLIVMETQYKKINSIAVTTHGYGGNNTCLFITKTS